MILAQSKSGRRFVGRLDGGVDFHEAVKKICEQHEIKCAEIRAIGAFSSVSLQDYDQERKSFRSLQRYKEPYAVLSLHGNVSSNREEELSVVAHASLSWEDRGRVHVIGGRVVEARIFFLEFVLEAFDDILLWRVPDSVTGLQLWGLLDRRDFHVESDEVAAIVEEPVVEADAPEPGEKDEIELKIGDYLEHPRLGRCEIVQIDGDERVHIRLDNGRIVVLSLVVCTLEPTGKKGNRQIYTVQIKRRR